MRVIVQDTLKNKQWVAYEGRAGFVIGRSEGCHVRLADSMFVSKQHVQIDKAEAGWQARLLESASPVKIDDKVVKPGEIVVLKPLSQIRLAEFVINLLSEDDSPQKRDRFEDANILLREMHTAVLRRLDLRRGSSALTEANNTNLELINQLVDELLQDEFKERVVGTPATMNAMCETAMETRLIAALSQEGGEKLITKISTPGLITALEENADEFVQRLVRRMKLGMTKDSMGADVEIINESLKQFLPPLIDEIPDNVKVYILSRYLKKVLCDMIFGLGPLQDLLDTPSVSEIMIVSPSLVYIERAGKVMKSNRTFLGDEALLSVIERIVGPLGRRIDRSSPLVDARLKDGSRVNAVIPPLALKGPCVTIRRFPLKRIVAQDLVKWGSLTPAGAALLEACVRAHKNVIVAGGTGSGKTTLLNVLSSFIPPTERIITIEDAAELQLAQEHVVSLETRPANVEGKGAYTIRDLVKNALRMRPDRIIVGECRGGEALDMLQAMNTGHSGSMTTVHANSAQDVFSRLENMVLTAVEIPIQAIRQQISDAVDIVVYQKRTRTGRRMVMQITEIVGLHPKTGEAETRDIMCAHEDDATPTLEATGYMPSFLGDLVTHNLLDLDTWFGEAQPS